MQKLTPHQAETLSSIKHYLEDRGFPLTRAEIVQRLDFKLSNVIEEYLEVLARKDAIEMIPGAPRGIRASGLESYAVSDDEGLPVIEWVVTGAPILAGRNIEEPCRIDPTFFDSRADYLLRAYGMSMKNIGTLDDDLLVVHVARGARDGQMAVTRIGEEVTVKRPKRENGKAQLLAENPEFAPTEVNLKEQELIIEGLSAGMARR